MPLEGRANDPDIRLAQGADQLGLPLRAEDRERLLAFLKLIAQWNRVYNLTALKTPDEMFTHHLLDCLAVVLPLDRWLASAKASRQPQLLDVGTGAGLPGVVLAILRPNWNVTCIDAVAKKVSFIRQVSGELGLPNLEAIHGRVENTGAWGERRFDLIVSRAFASLADFVRLTRHVLACEAAWAAMKAQLTDEEIAAVPPDVEMFHVEHLSVPELEAQRRLVWLRPRMAGSRPTPEPRQ